MLIHLIRTLELPSAAYTNSLDLPLVHLCDVTSEIIFVDECRAPVPGAFYFVLYLASLRDGGR
jgi:hypothetical protein